MDFSGSGKRTHLVLLVVLCAATWISTCGLWDLRGPDEARYVQVAKELKLSNPFGLTIFGIPYGQKPPLPFWFLAGALKLSGGAISSWALRMPSVLMGIGTVVLTYFMARRLTGGNSRAGFIAGLILITTPEFYDNVTQAQLNVPFTFWITLSFWYLEPEELGSGAPMRLRSIVAAWLALAAAFFTKGPLALLIVALVILAEALARRSWRPVLRCHMLSGFIVLGVLIGLWLYAEHRAFGSQFVAEQLGGQTVHRFLSGAHSEVFWYYFPRLFQMIFPWIFLLPFAARRLWQLRGTDEWNRLRPYATWIVLPFIVLCCANGKRNSYLLPLLPPFAVLCGWFVATQLEGSKLDKWVMVGRNASRALLLVSGLVLIAAGANAIVRPQTLQQYQISLTHWMIGEWIVAGAIIVLVATVWPVRRFGTISLLAAFMVTVNVLQNSTIEPALDPSSSTRHFAKEIYDIGIRDLGVASRAAKPEYHVYARYNVVPLNPESIHLPDAPKHVLVNRDSAMTSGVVSSSGYHPWRNFEVSNDALVIFVRDDSGAAKKAVPTIPDGT